MVSASVASVFAIQKRPFNAMRRPLGRGNDGMKMEVQQLMIGLMKSCCRKSLDSTTPEE